MVPYCLDAGQNASGNRPSIAGKFCLQLVPGGKPGILECLLAVLTGWPH